MKQTLADFKRRIKVGQRLVLIEAANPTHKFLNVPRVVIHTQGNAFCVALALDAPKPQWSWADWPKSKDLVFVGDEFTMNGMKYQLLP